VPYKPLRPLMYSYDHSYCAGGQAICSAGSAG
jgi:hypothetical protein